MARAIAFLPNLTSKSGPTDLDIDKIPQDVKDDVEAMYAALKTNHGRMRLTFESKAELHTFLTQANAYCNQRPEFVTITDDEGNETVIAGGPIRLRRSPTRDLPDNVMDLKITDLKTENEQTTEGIREAAAKAGGTPVPAPAAATVAPTKRTRGKAA